MSIFSNACWRCWPKLCKCPPNTTEAEQMKSEIFLLDSELQRENRRAREFSKTITGLALAVEGLLDARIADGGLDAVPHDLIELRNHTREAAQSLSDEPNLDRVGAMYAALSQGEQG